MSFSSASSSTIFSSNAFLNPGPAPPPPQEHTHHLAHSRMLSNSTDAFAQYPPKRIDSNKQTHSPSGSDSSYNDSNPSANGSPTSTTISTTSSFNNAAPSPRDDPKGRFIKHGWVVTKEDGAFKMWNRKYLVLRESSLEFYKNEVSLFYLNPRFSFALTHQGYNLVRIYLVS